MSRLAAGSLLGTTGPFSALPKIGPLLLGRVSAAILMNLQIAKAVAIDSTIAGTPRFASNLGAAVLTFNRAISHAPPLDSVHTLPLRARAALTATQSAAPPVVSLVVPTDSSWSVQPQFHSAYEPL